MSFVTRARSSIFIAAFLAVSASGVQAGTGGTAFQMAVAESASPSPAIAEFYRTNGFDPVWVGNTPEHAARRTALIRALSTTDLHGLPGARYDVQALMTQMQNARTTRDLGLLEAELTRVFVKYASDLQSGAVRPSQIDAGLVRSVERRTAGEHLELLVSGEGDAYFKKLMPQSRQYRSLLKQKKALEALIAQGGWGETVPVSKLELGDSGANVIKLRNRLVAMGYLKPTASPIYDDVLLAAVQSFQTAHGLEPDGVAGKGTITEINRPVSDRLKAVHVALERERWLPEERGERHILVNQADFSAKIVDDGQVTFETRAVIGKNTDDRRSPEFSDEMEHMVINPSWYVPRSIITKEYLPKLRANPNAVGHIQITDRRGRQVNRGAVDFNQFTARNFPFSMRQPPSKSNALGLVKFMFPNKHNIYLHDTPQKSLFSREVRAFSHGCIRLAQPFEFAYALLAKQQEDPKAFFHRVLNTGKETKVNLDEPVPVHLIYRTAYIGPMGDVQYRRDVYDRDRKIWEALQKAGVALPDVQG
ncbi:peptidoglycan-binding protein [Ruegeria sp. ANG-R]|uniref:L,D-transpeptidase family protein n=1 Tax=Ruegeria sp. ANG-R TaxID=1577903 RepID=UPI00057FF574|nr:L,D-transpeptidase family protein [Ruegeria sp. ANG-R]KIC42762.1 peptidoglycan-binding protein [Ruegeria sp. ANG-R]